MAQYIVPPDTSEKEKIVGGLLTGGQLVWVLAGLGGWALFGLGLYGFMGKFSFIFSFPFVPVAGVFAFYKKHELTFFDYLSKRREHRKKTKHLPNLRKETLKK